MAKARPTIRCLLDELAGSAALDVSVRSALASGSIADLGPLPLDDIEHPLLTKATETLAGREPEEIRHLRISAVTDNAWYRVKAGQARSAAWIDDEGTPWLCAVGVRRDGDRDDFYAEFGRRCASGSSVFLPTEQDRHRVGLERVRRADEFRLRLLRLSVVRAVAKACKEGVTQTIGVPTALESDSLHPRYGALLHVEVTADDGHDGDLTLSLVITDYGGNRYEDLLLEVRSAIPGLPLDDWDVLPAHAPHLDPCWYTLIETVWVGRLVAELEERGLEGFVDNPPDLTDGPGGFTHIVASHGLTSAIVNNTPTRGSLWSVVRTLSRPNEL